MDLFDKINGFAKTATEKTNNAIEIGKLSAKIEEEKRNSNAIIKKIGEHFVAKMDAGETLDEEAFAMYQSLLQSRKTVEGMYADMETLKASKTSETAPSAKFCPYCGVKLDPNAKFCMSCGKEQ